MNNKTVTQARLQFRSVEAAVKVKDAGNAKVKQCPNNEYWLDVPGIAITDNFEAIDQKSNANKRVYIMAVPFIGGYNPDYSGLDFCEEASSHVVENIFSAM